MDYILDRHRGRAATTKPECHVSNVTVVKPSREGELSLSIAGPTLQLKRWLVQWRRLKNLVRMLPVDTTAQPSATAVALYNKIKAAKGFSPSFSQWWLTKPVTTAHAPDQLPQTTPTKVVAGVIEELMAMHVRHMEQTIRDDRIKQVKNKHQRNANAVFNHVKGEGNKPVDTLLEIAWRPQW